MGYESKVYLVEDSGMKIMPGEKKIYSSVVAVFNLGNMGDGPFEELFTKAHVASCYFYLDDGNTQAVEDRYGEELKEVSIDELLAALEKETETCREEHLLIATLKAIGQNKDCWKNIKAIRYGY